MRRFVTLAVLLLFSIPFGVSVSGCSHTAAPVYCNGGDSGITTAQVTNISLTPVVYGISLNFAEIGQINAPSATNCKGSNASVGAYIYGTTNMAIADVQPNSGRLCGGTWNRNSGGGIPDYTYCTPTNQSGVAYVSASANGVTSNPIPVFVHPVVTSIVLGGPSSNCTTDPTTACCPLAVNPVIAPPYLANSCVSQGTVAQLVARVWAGTGDNQINISCLAGHLQYTAQGAASQTAVSPVVSIDQNGVATANQPGSVLISANISNAASSAGFFSTCPPASITLSAPGALQPGTSTNPILINQNNPQPLQAVILDTNGNTLTGLALAYESTSPITIPASSSGSVTPSLAGAASISAICEPSFGCNSSAYNQIGLFGNGKPITSNSINLASPGTNGTVLYMASTESLYMVSRDFTQTAQTPPFLLPYLPNSMVITNDGSTIYMGSSAGLMVLNAVNTLSLTRTDPTSTGTVLAVSPDGTMVVISDPVKQITTIESSSGGVITTYGGVGTHAEFAPDDQTVYITAGNQILIYSSYTGWTSISPATAAGMPVTDVAITVPSVGAYFAGPVTTARGYCPSSTATTVGGVTTETNNFYPPADSAAVVTDRIAATNDGEHIVGATATTTPATLYNLRVQIPSTNPLGPTVSIACPTGTQTTTGGITTGITGGLAFSNTVSTIHLSSTTPAVSIAAGSITGVLPTSDSSLVVVTYTPPSGSTGTVPSYLPAYAPSTGINFIKLSGAATAPLAGVISADNSTIYVGTATDNLVHLITGTPGAPSTYTDTSTLAPALTPAPGVTPVPPNAPTVPVNLLVQKPRRTT
jgi:hypothetical protein